ncbi:MAG: hypothetical protein FJ291_19735 [Planctomycetes bacterium]|nr:hypothetical protein [Planctomycetota bacterium]
MIEHIKVKGYRLFKDLETKLRPDINVFLGANGAGKSTFVELLRIIASCGMGRIPSGIESRPFIGEVLHPDASGAMEWRVKIAPQRLPEGLAQARYTYGATIRHPERPTIENEVLERERASPAQTRTRARGGTEGGRPVAKRAWALAGKKLLFRAADGEGIFHEYDRKHTWKLGPGECLLSRATDPRFPESYAVRNEVLLWRFYTEFRATRTAPLREPQALGDGTVLDESGKNLGPALLSLFTNLEHESNRDELLSFLRSALPEFATLRPTVDPSGRYVLLQWRERDVDATLSAADLADGALRLLLLGVVCCTPYPPPVLCIDEPEIGLHPKVLPLVGGLLQYAAERSQVIVLTHSPDLLYDMPLENIAVLRKRDGEAQIVWPRDHALLYDIVTEEIAGEKQVDEERLRLAFRSGELDELG